MENLQLAAACIQDDLGRVLLARYNPSGELYRHLYGQLVDSEQSDEIFELPTVALERKKSYVSQLQHLIKCDYKLDIRIGAEMHQAHIYEEEDGIHKSYVLYDARIRRPLIPRPLDGRNWQFANLWQQSTSRNLCLGRFAARLSYQLQSNEIRLV